MDERERDMSLQIGIMIVLPGRIDGSHRKTLQLKFVPLVTSDVLQHLLQQVHQTRELAEEMRVQRRSGSGKTMAKKEIREIPVHAEKQDGARFWRISPPSVGTSLY